MDPNRSYPVYRGRIAPTPSGKLHLGHVQTFMLAQRRVRSKEGCLVLRIEDLDKGRCKQQYLELMIKDMLWMGLKWDEGPTFPSSVTIDASSMYIQSNRMTLYFDAMRKLLSRGLIYPSRHSRRDVEKCLSAPQERDESAGERSKRSVAAPVDADEVDSDVFPSVLRPPALDAGCVSEYLRGEVFPPANGENWRFRVPYDIPGQEDRWVSFRDENMGLKQYRCGLHFGDFLVWGGQEYKPSYELAVVVDDADMGITEVVRGCDLLGSTARQLLLYEALGLTPPAFFHVPLVRDESGKRLAKRCYNSAYTIESLREQGGLSPEQVVQGMTDLGNY